MGEEVNINLYPLSRCLPVRVWRVNRFLLNSALVFKAKPIFNRIKFKVSFSVCLLCCSAMTDIFSGVFTLICGISHE